MEDSSSKSSSWGKFIVGIVLGTFLVAPYKNGELQDEITWVKGVFTDKPEIEDYDYSKDFEQIRKDANNQTFRIFRAKYGDDALELYEKYKSYNNRANQLNPNNDAYWQSRGYDQRPDNWEDIYNNDYYYSQDEIDNRANQLNPNNDAYWQSRGYDERPDNWEDAYEDDDYSYSQDDWDNYSDQLNPNNDAYWQSRGYDERPDDWESRK